MTQEEKQILLQELCMRFPYRVKADVMGWDEEKGEEVFVPVTVYSVNTDGYVFFDDNDYDIIACSIDACRLYLRPMSSMTQEERLIYEQRLHDVGRSIDVIDADDVVPHIDWLLSRHLDFRGLIPMGLALEALPGMYKTE